MNKRMLKLTEDEVDAEIENSFMQFYLSIPDADETLIEKVNGKFKDDFVNNMFFMFDKGARAMLVNMIAKREFGLVT